MPDYKTMYFKLFFEIIKIIEQYETTQLNLEKEYIESKAPPIRVVKSNKEELLQD